ncbi:(2Fe-2S)-binding protein [Paraburkholderia sp. GAS348]|uniref:(2Fe-2S)-binding protein n=1 Tax=Paraburkholderia sp. GAS348 TaxID=3035132 RepID=UPI003D19DF46
MPMQIQNCVNGAPRTIDTEPRRLLVHLLRDTLGLTGVHIGCDTSQCGACTVLIDQKTVKSCTVLAVQTEGCSVQTIEGMAHDPITTALKSAFNECHGLQCGFCTPGMLIAARALLVNTSSPSEEAVREALHGNLCRCTGYQNIVDAVLLAAARLKEQAAQPVEEASHE